MDDYDANETHFVKSEQSSECDEEEEDGSLRFNKKTWKEDLTLVAEDKELFVSRNILALVSPVFNAMFESGFKEKAQNAIELKGKKYKEVLEFLRCIYPPQGKQVSEENVHIVLPLADEYQVESLKKACEEYLLELVDDSMSCEDLLTYLKLSVDYNLDNLKEECLEIGTYKSQNDLEAAEEYCPLPVDVKLDLQRRTILSLDKRLSKKRETNEDQEFLIKFYWGGNKISPTDLPIVYLKYNAKMSDAHVLSKSALEKHCGMGWSLGFQATKHLGQTNDVLVTVEGTPQPDWISWTLETEGNVFLKIDNAFLYYSSFRHMYGKGKESCSVTDFFSSDNSRSRSNIVLQPGTTEMKIFVILKINYKMFH